MGCLSCKKKKKLSKKSVPQYQRGGQHPDYNNGWNPYLGFGQRGLNQNSIQDFNNFTNSHFNNRNEGIYSNDYQNYLKGLLANDVTLDERAVIAGADPWTPPTPEQREERLNERGERSDTYYGSRNRRGGGGTTAPIDGFPSDTEREGLTHRPNLATSNRLTEMGANFFGLQKGQEAYDARQDDPLEIQNTGYTGVQLAQYGGSKLPQYQTGNFHNNNQIFYQEDYDDSLNKLNTEKDRIKKYQDSVIEASQFKLDNQIPTRTDLGWIEDGRYFCNSHTCEVLQDAGFTIPEGVEPVTINKKTYGPGSKFPLIPGNEQMTSYLPQLGFERLPDNNFQPGDLVFHEEYKGSDYQNNKFSPRFVASHSLIADGNGKFYNSPGGSRHKYALQDYLVKNPESNRLAGYRLKSDLPKLQSEHEVISENLDQQKFNRNNELNNLNNINFLTDHYNKPVKSLSKKKKKLGSKKVSLANLF